MRGVAGCTALMIAIAGCSPAGPDLSPAAKRGETTYYTVCIACHNAKPSLDGLGPPLAGASRELLEARVLRGVHPPGHQPRRKTQSMPVFPHLAANIDDLAAYLAECCPAQ